MKKTIYFFYKNYFTANPYNDMQSNPTKEDFLTSAQQQGTMSEESKENNYTETENPNYNSHSDTTKVNSQSSVVNTRLNSLKRQETNDRELVGNIIFQIKSIRNNDLKNF